MTDKVKVSKWFDKWLKDRIKLTSKENIIAIISQCQFYDLFEEYEEKGNRHFNKKQHEEVREHFEEYIRAVLNGYEVEEEKTPLGWIPEVGEEYWVVTLFDHHPSGFRNTKDEMDMQVFEKCKVFKTKQDAEFEAEKMKVTRELEKFACNYKTGEENYYLYASLFPRAVIKINFSHWSKEEKIYFESENKAKRAIKKVGQDRILKYYFGV